MVHNMLEGILKCEIDIRLELFLLNIIWNIKDKGKRHIYVITAARILFAQKWKSEVIPNMELIEKIYQIGHTNRKDEGR